MREALELMLEVRMAELAAARRALRKAQADVDVARGVVNNVRANLGLPMIRKEAA
jgi:hypothetical protein